MNIKIKSASPMPTVSIMPYLDSHMLSTAINLLSKAVKTVVDMDIM